MQLKTTDQAAQELGMTHDNLRLYIWRHPEFRPASSVHVNLYVWTDEEIERVREARASGKPRPVSRQK